MTSVDMKLKYGVVQRQYGKWMQTDGFGTVGKGDFQAFSTSRSSNMKWKSGKENAYVSEEEPNVGHDKGYSQGNIDSSGRGKSMHDVVLVQDSGDIGLGSFTMGRGSQALKEGRGGHNKWKRATKGMKRNYGYGTG
ncbi:hypothetical protein REPUB_Repub01dG0095000 [Reevesia pubescens]